MNSNATERFERLRRRLALLDEFDADRQVFGAQAHDYSLAEPWSEGQIVAFEAEHDVSLPLEYRAFIGAVGSHGAGPYYGLAKPAPLELDQLPVQFVIVSDGDGNELGRGGTGPREVPDARSSIQRRCPLTREWAPGDAPMPGGPGASPYDGCIHLAEQGCGYFDFLIVRGPSAGQVWSDYTAGGGPICPANDDFLEWYEAWLESALVEFVEQQAVEIGLYAPRNFEPLAEAFEAFEAAREQAPEWVGGWRARGYLALNSYDWDSAALAFARAAELGEQEPVARLHLDTARVASLQEQYEVVLSETEAGLLETELWASTEDELRAERLAAFDALGRAEDALALLAELMDDSFHRDYHYDKATRHLERSEPDLAWAALDHAIEHKVGRDPDEVRPTQAGVYEEFAQLLDVDGRHELAARVRARLDPSSS